MLVGRQSREKTCKIPPDLRFAEIVNKQKKLKPQTAAAYQLNPWLVCFKQQQKMKQFLAKSRKHPAKILLIFYLARKFLMLFVMQPHLFSISNHTLARITLRIFGNIKSVWSYRIGLGWWCYLCIFLQNTSNGAFIEN